MAEKKLLLFLLLFSLVLLTFFPQLQTKFTTNDDTLTALQAGQHSHMAYALKEAKEQGRFQFALGYLGAQLPYLIDHDWYFQLIRLGSFLLNFWLYFILVRNLSKSTELALLATVMALAFLQNNWQHSLVTAYPFLYHLGLSLFFLSIITYLRGNEQEDYKYIVISGLLFLAACLTYESFIPLFLLYPVLLVFFRRWGSPSEGTRKGRMFHFLTPHLAALLVYLAAYVIFRSFFPGKNPGVQLGIFSWQSFFTVVKQFIISTFPGYFFVNDPGSMDATFDGLTRDYPGIVSLFKHLKGDWLLKGTIVALASGYLLRQSITFLNKRSFFIALIFGLGMMILPVSLLGLTSKYQDWVAKGTLAYVPCYFAFFGTMVFIGTILIGVSQIIFSRKILHLFFIGVSSALLFIASLATDFYNYYITLDQQLSQVKWKAFDLLLETDDFKQIPDGSLIYAPTLWRYRGIMANQPSYWSDYVRTKMKRTLVITRDQEELRELSRQTPSTKLYFLSLWPEDKDPSQFLILAEIDKTHNVHLLPLSKKVNLFIYGRHRKGYLWGTLSATEPKPVLTVDGSPLPDLKGTIYSGVIDNTLKSDNLKKTVLRSNAFFELENITLSFFPVQVRLSTYRSLFKDGFYSEEGGGIRPTWYWSSGNALIEIVNTLPKPTPVIVELKLGTLESRRVEILIGGTLKTGLLLGPYEDRPVRLAIDLQPGPNLLEFRTNTPAMKPKQGADPRNLSFKVTDFNIADAPSKKQK